jgi:hypothetical protein
MTLESYPVGRDTGTVRIYLENKQPAFLYELTSGLVSHRWRALLGRRSKAVLQESQTAALGLTFTTKASSGCR